MFSSFPLQFKQRCCVEAPDHGATLDYSTGGVGDSSSAYAVAKPPSRSARDSTEIFNSSSLHFLNDYVWETHTPKPSASTAAEIVPAKDEWLGAFSPFF